jgi:hypothetical protein
VPIVPAAIPPPIPPFAGDTAVSAVSLDVGRLAIILKLYHHLVDSMRQLVVVGATVHRETLPREINRAPYTTSRDVFASW